MTLLRWKDFLLPALTFAVLAAPLALPAQQTADSPSVGLAPAQAPESNTLNANDVAETTTAGGTSISGRAAIPAPLSEFELLAADAAGKPLPVYGRRFFSDVPSTFAPLDHIPVPADYVVGPGDQLLIRVWGKIELNSAAGVDRNGQIYLPKIGALTVSGLRFEQLQGFLESEVGKLYKGFELNVTMGQLRSIQVYIVGSARQPGVFTISSLSTLVNALFASGGPSNTGTMRRIQLNRGNRLVTEFDFYDLLRNGDKSHDVPLLPGDVIFIPPVGPQVAVLGSLNEPGIYELKGEETIASVIKDAAGLTNLAGTDRILLEQIENHRRRRVDDFALDQAGFERVLRDGDILEIFPISPKFENAITLRGNVAQTGRYPWHDGMRVSDVIHARAFLITGGYWNQQNHLVGNSATNPNPDMLADLNQNNAEINWEYAAIERLDERDLSTRVIPFNLGKALDNPESAENQVLQIGDVITIFSRKDIALPQDQHAAFVRISGEVNAPGVYRIGSGETLRQAVERAGGLTPHSYLYASQLTRVSTRLVQEEQLRLAINQMQRELISRYAPATTLNAATVPMQQAQLSQQQALVAQLASAHPTGRIVLDMKPRAGAVADIPEFSLEDGDSFYIPPRLGTIQVTGAVYNENAFRYQARKRLSSYLKDAGGPTRQADARRIFLIRADGTVISRQNHGVIWRDNFDSLELLPGDAIIVPTKLKSPSGILQQLPFITQMISQTALTGALASSAF